MKKSNERILKNFRDSIAISNLKEELVMKKAIKKQILMLSMVSIVFLSGSFVTVNAATGGALVNNIKSMLFNDAQSKVETKIKEDTFEVEEYNTDESGELKSSTYTFEDKNGNTYKIYDIKE